MGSVKELFSIVIEMKERGFTEEQIVKLLDSPTLVAEILQDKEKIEK